jgi:hypothetical protein
MARIYIIFSGEKNVIEKNPRGLFSDDARIPRRGRLGIDPLEMCKFKRAQKTPTEAGVKP